MAIKIDQFSGIAPKISPDKLPGNAAVIAQNCRVDRGSLRPIKAPSLVATLPNTANSIFYYDQSSMWLYWNTTGIDVALSPVSLDAYSRFYWTGEAYPMYSYQGRPSANLPNGFKLGVPAPGNAPTVGKSGTITGTPEDRYYVFTYVTPIGEEGPPSAPSSVISVTTTETVTLNFIADSLTSYNLGAGALRRIYRTVQGTSGTQYQFVKDIPIATLTTTDALLDAQTGELLPSAGYFPPPTDLQGIKATPNGYLVGFTGNTLCPSEAFLPHAWNPANQISFPSPVTGLAITGDSIVVFTKEMPYLVTGTTPDSLSAIQIDHPQTCANKASIVNMGGYAMFVSPDGICSVSANDLIVATKNFYTREQWQAFTPSTAKAFFYEGIYIVFTSGVALMFDVREQPAILTQITGYSFVSGYQDLQTDTLYLLEASTGKVYSWETGSSLTAAWKTKPVRVQHPTCPAAARIFATGPVTVQLWADGSSVFGPTTISDSNPFRLPSGYRAMEFQAQVQVSSGVEVQSLTIADALAELQ